MSYYPPAYPRDNPTQINTPLPTRSSTQSGCRRYGLASCLIGLLPLVIACGLVGGVFLAAWRSGRLNVLILGLDRRSGQTGPVRSDSLILATFEPAQPQAALLSIPRDLWVDIPGQGAN